MNSTETKGKIMTTETKHTPGPWYCDENDRLNPDRSYGIARDPGPLVDTEVIAEVCASNVPGLALADAQLIAAAPALLEALQLLLKEADRFIPSNQPYEYEEAAFQAQRAIARAKGIAQ